MKMVSIGYLASSHGIQGQAKIKGYGSSWENLNPPFDVTISKNSNTTNITIASFSIKPGYILIQTEDITQPEIWLEWVGGSVLIDKQILDSIYNGGNRNEYFFYQLEELEVRNENNQNTGFVVTSVEENSAHAILILTGNGRKISIPFVDEWVGEVNLPLKFLVVKNWEMWNEI